MIPAKYFFTRGDGEHVDKLTSFEHALRDAQIYSYNLVKVSSIIPPKANKIPLSEGITQLKPGEIVFCVLSENSANEPSRLMCASVGAANTKDDIQHGYLSEYHGFGRNFEFAGPYGEYLAAYMLDTILKLPNKKPTTQEEKEELERIKKSLEENSISPNKFDKEIWRSLEKKYKEEGRIYKTENIAQSATVGKEGKYKTVIAVAVFIPEDPHQFMIEQIGLLKKEQDLFKNDYINLQEKIDVLSKGYSDQYNKLQDRIEVIYKELAKDIRFLKEENVKRIAEINEIKSKVGTLEGIIKKQ